MIKKIILLVIAVLFICSIAYAATTYHYYEVSKRLWYVDADPEEDATSQYYGKHVKYYFRDDDSGQVDHVEIVQ